MRGDYWNTNEVRKWLASIQIDAEENPCSSTNGFGYVDEQDEFFGAVMVTKKVQEDEDDYL